MFIGARGRTLALGVSLLSVGMSQVRGADIFAHEGVIHIVGRIEAGDDVQFRTVVSAEILRRPGEPIERVRIYSPGGNLPAALRIGEQVNSLQLDTLVPLTNKALRFCYIGSTTVTFEPNARKGDPRCECASACFFIWAAGASRGGDIVGVHRPSFNPSDFSKMSPEEARVQYNAVLLRARSFLQNWGIPADVIDDAFAVSSASLSYLAPDTLRRLRRAAHVEEQIIAKCGTHLTEEQYLDELVQLNVNKQDLWDEAEKKVPRSRPKWNAAEHLRRVDFLFKPYLCQKQVLREIRLQTNATYLKTRPATSEALRRVTEPGRDPATKAEARAVLARILASAGIDHATVSTVVDDPAAADFDAMWTTGQVLGWIRVWGDRSQDHATAMLAEGGSGTCQGQFVRSPVQPGTRQTRVSTSCTVSATERTESHFVVFPRPKGGVYVIATLSVGLDSFEAARAAHDRLATAIDAAGHSER